MFVEKPLYISLEFYADHPPIQGGKDTMGAG